MITQFKSQAKRKTITFSSDDGVTQDIRLIELLNKYGLKCTFNLSSELLVTKGILIRQNKRIAHYKIAPEDVKYVYEGHKVAAHTLTHPNLTKLTESEIQDGTNNSRKDVLGRDRFKVYVNSKNRYKICRSLLKGKAVFSCFALFKYPINFSSIRFFSKLASMYCPLEYYPASPL